MKLTPCAVVVALLLLASCRTASAQAVPNLAGIYTLTVTARSCTPGVPDEAKRRTYTARINQTDRDLRVTLTGADFAHGSGTFLGAVQPSGEIGFGIRPLTVWDYDIPDLEERLSDGHVVMIFGSITATSTPAGILGTALSQEAGIGGIFYLPASWSTTWLAEYCYIDQLAFTLTPPPTADGDGDGLPDDWEIQFGLSPFSASGADGANGDPDADGLTNAQEFANGSHPTGTITRYFAEGARTDFFSSQFAFLNPDPSTTATVNLKFLKPDGTFVTRFLAVPPMSRRTLTNNDLYVLGSTAFSTIVESNVAVVVDRTMTWDATGYGSHAETSIPAPATTWYLAEGATHSGFDLFYLLQNANDVAAQVRVKYLFPSGAPIEKDYSVPARSRFTIWVDVDDPRLANTDVSAVFTSALPIIVERAMYLSSGGKLFNAGHGSAGVTAAATEWFLAEGATGNYFDLYVLVANPSNSDATVEATFLLPDGTSIVRSYTVPANSRFNIFVNGEDTRLADTAVSTVITSTNGVPVIVERSMWWPGPTFATWAEAHNSAGLTSTGKKWALAEGEVGGPRGLETYILIANRGLADTAKVTLLFEDGTTASKVFALAAGSRTNVNVAADFPGAAGKRFGAIIEAANAGAQIAVERSMYSNANGVVWAAGTNAVATKLQ